MVSTQVKQLYETDTQQYVAVTSPDNVRVSGQLASGDSSCHGCCRTSAESGLATPRSCDACSTSLARCSSLLRMPESNLFGVWMCCAQFCQASVCIPGPTSAVDNWRLTGREPTDGHEQFSTEPKAPLRAVRRSRGQPAGVPGQRGDSCRLRPLHPVGTMPSTNYPVGGQV